MLGRKTRTESNSQRGQIRSRMLSIVRSKWKLAVLCFVFIPATIISATNLTTPTAYAAVTIDQCVALNDKGRDAGSISKETYENSGVCNIMRRYTNLDKEQVKTDCGSKYGGTWAEFLGGWACNLIPLTDGVNSRNGSRTIDPSIQTEAECESVNGIWTADGNFEGQGEMGTCQVTVGAAAESDDEEGEDSSCQIENVGWIICPVMTAIASVTDVSYEAVERLLLVPSSMFNRSDSTGSYAALNSAWSMIRDVANVAFVIAFLLIIYSQLTSRGLGNYGVKKMLPRLIVSAILVNSSFVISALAVDISNIVGANVHGVFSGLSENIDGASVGDTAWGTTGNAWGAILAVVLAGGTLMWLHFSVLAPILVIVVFAILTVILVLTLRHALLVLLVVIAPLAFVAFLLPNTENLFKKWMNLFIVLLAMFPAIALIFSMSKLAGAIVMASSNDMLVQIAGAGMTIIPLFITPIVMKTAGTTLGRLTGIMDIGAKKGLYGKAKSLHASNRDRLSAQRKSRSIGRGEKIIGGSGGKLLGASGSKRRRAIGSIASLGATSSIHRDEALRNAKTAEQDATQDYLAKQLGDKDNNLAKVLATNEEQIQSIRARATATVDKQEDSEVAEREILMRATFKDPRKTVQEAADALDKAIEADDTIGAKAAQNILLGSGSFGVTKLRETLSKSEDNGNLAGDSDVSNALRRDLAKAGLKGKDNALNTWAIKNAGSLSEVTESASTYSGLSDAELLGQSVQTLEKVHKSKAVTPEHAAEMLNNPSLASNFTKDKREIFQAIANGQQLPNPSSKINSNPKDKFTQAQAQPQSQPQTSQASSTKDGTLTINHDKPSISTPSTSTANQSVSAKQAAPAAAQSPQPVFNPNQNQQPVSQPSGWTQTDSGLSVPRSAAQPAPVQQVAPPTAQSSNVNTQPTPVQTTQQAAPAPVVQQVVQQPSPTQNSQPQKVQVELDTSGLDKSLKNAVNEIGNKPVVIDKGNFTVTDKRSGSQPSSFGSSGPSSLSSSKPTDIDGRHTPPTAPEDYHDRMSK